MQFVDPEVSKRKFEQEMSLFEDIVEAQRRRGVILLASEFPNAYFGFLATSLSPAPLVFAVRFNFDNYDVNPISVRFVDPFSFETLKINQVLTHFPRNIAPSGQPSVL